ncbi:MAG: protein kinase, partial [Myxococcota bacterium]
HRDIKPDNLFIVDEPDGSESIKVLDFGIAQVTTEGVSANETQEGLFLGSPAHCAPEQATGGRAAESADIYALGSTLFEVLSGELPFDGDAYAVLQAKLTHPAPSLHILRPELDPAVASTLALLLQRDPTERPAHMGQVQELLGRWKTDHEGSSSRWKHARFRRRAMGAIALGAGLTVASALVLALGSSSSASVGSSTERLATEQPATERPATERPATERPATEQPTLLSSSGMPANVPQIDLPVGLESPPPDRPSPATPVVEPSREMAPVAQPDRQPSKRSPRSARHRWRPSPQPRDDPSAAPSLPDSPRQHSSSPSPGSRPPPVIVDPFQ